MPFGTFSQQRLPSLISTLAFVAFFAVSFAFHCRFKISARDPYFFPARFGKIRNHFKKLEVFAKNSVKHDTARWKVRAGTPLISKTRRCPHALGLIRHLSHRIAELDRANFTGLVLGCIETKCFFSFFLFLCFFRAHRTKRSKHQELFRKIHKARKAKTVEGHAAGPANPSLFGKPSIANLPRLWRKSSRT